MFADDTCLSMANDSIQNLFNSANNELALLNKWFTSNKLTLNKEKTNYVIFQKRNHPFNQQTYELKIQDHKIQEKQSVKYLGVIIEKNLSFKEHVNHIGKKLRKNIPALLRS